MSRLPRAVPARASAVLRAQVRDPLYLQSHLLLAGTAIAAVTGFAFWILAARLTDATTVGRAAGLISAVSLVSYLTSLGLPYGILRFGGATKGFSSMVNLALLVSAATSVLASVLFVVGAGWWAPALEGVLASAAALLFFAAANVAAALSTLLDNLFAARRAAQIALVRNAASGLGKLALVVALAGEGALGLFWAGMAPVIVASVVVVALLPRLQRDYRPRELELSAPVRDFASFSLRNYPAALFGGAPPFFLPLIALAVTDPRQTAFFYVAWSLVGVLLVLPTVVSHISLSEGARHLPWDIALRGRTFALVMITPAVAGLLLLAGPLLSIFGPGYPEGATDALRLLALSLFPWTFMSLSLAGLRGESRYRELTLATAVFGVLSLAGPIGLGLAFGLDGIAAGWTLGVLLATLIIEFRVRELRSSGREPLLGTPEDVAPIVP